MCLRNPGSEITGLHYNHCCFLENQWGYSDRIVLNEIKTDLSEEVLSDLRMKLYQEAQQLLRTT